jgi:hypothetical protein
MSQESQLELGSTATHSLVQVEAWRGIGVVSEVLLSIGKQSIQLLQCYSRFSGTFVRGFNNSGAE